MGDGGVKVFGREPTLWLAVISSIIVLLGTFSLHWLTGQQAALIVVAINAIAGAVNAFTVRPIAPAAFTYATASIIAVAGAYGLNLTIEQVASVNALVVPMLALLSRNQVSPQRTALTGP